MQRPTTLAQASCAARANSMIGEAEIVGKALPSDKPSYRIWKPAYLAAMKCIKFQTHRHRLTGKQPKCDRHTVAIAASTQPTFFYRSQRPPSRCRDSGGGISVNQATYDTSRSGTATAYRSCTIIHACILIQLGYAV